MISSPGLGGSVSQGGYGPGGFQFDLNCNDVSGPFLIGCILEGSVWNMLWTNDPLPHPGQKKALLPRALPPLSPRSPALALHPLEQ